MALWFGPLGHLIPLGSLLTFLAHQTYGQILNCCNLFKGRRVFDDTYPLYNASNCPFVGFDCQENGRPDQMYLKYRRKPDGCSLPRFNGKEFLERLRGRKMMFVGDSLSSNQWQSLACMLYSAVPNSEYTLVHEGLLFTFSVPEYGVSIMFMENRFLVDLEVEKVGRVIKLDSISTGNLRKGVDILIFNSYHWWNHTGPLKTWYYFQFGDKMSREMDRMEAYKIALTTWGKWVDSNIDFSKTIVFFQGISAVHYIGKEWNEPRVKICYGQTQPIKRSNYPGNHYPGEGVLKRVLRKMTKPVYLLDIALLTQLRKDGHPSKYAGGGVTDCSHWCLAGVPDTWNELLYTILLHK